MSLCPPASLTASFLSAASRFPDRPAVSFEDRTLTYVDLFRAVGACAASLTELGVGPDQRVAILFPNCPQFIISYFAALQLGATVVPLHCLQGPEELAYIVANAEAETLIGLNLLEPVMAAVRENVPCLRRLIVSGPSKLADAVSFEGLLKPPQSSPPVHDSRPDDVAVLIYTSGTTGQPKGAMLTHDNLVFDAAACAVAIDVNENDVFGTVLPLFHSFGATVCMILPLSLGAHTVLIPKFAPLSVLETLESRRCTVFAGVPSMYAVMLGMKTDRDFDLSSLRIGVSGGAAMPDEVLLGFEQRFGVYMIEGYGPTEASPVVSVNRTDGTRKIGTIGPPLPEIEVTIRDDDFNVAPVDVPGELCVRGRNVMKGYWRDEERTAETIRDGWLLTGDVATVDADGYLRIVDRKKDMIIVGGMNVYSREVEDVLYRLGAVAEAAVVGIPNRLRGEDVKAYVALKEGAQLDATQVIEHCKSHLANYTVPRFVEFRPELPKSATGKILKRELREEARAAMADEPVS